MIIDLLLSRLPKLSKNWISMIFFFTIINLQLDELFKPATPPTKTSTMTSSSSEMKDATIKPIATRSDPKIPVMRYPVNTDMMAPSKTEMKHTLFKRCSMHLGKYRPMSACAS